MTVIGPFDKGDFITMQKLKDNIKYFRAKEEHALAEQFRGNLKEYFRKAA